VLALPALRRAAELAREGSLVVQVVEALAPVVAMAGIDAELLPLRDRHAVVRAARDLRARAPDAGVLLTPSFSAALILRLAGVRERRGTDTDARGWLLTDPVERAPLLAGHRVREYLVLVDPGWSGDGPPAPRLRPPEGARRAWAELARTLPPGDGRPVLGLVPGSAAPSRRWPADRFAELAARRARAGDRVLVFGGAGDVEAAGSVAGAAHAAFDLSGRTSLEALVGGLAACDAVVANDTGPMHVAAAVGTPLVALFGAGDPDQTGPLSPHSRVVARRSLPCVPCLRNRCPRRGAGYELPEARLECLRVLDVDEVEEALMKVRRESVASPEEGGDDGR
jgi:heptosyltransferase-2